MFNHNVKNLHDIWIPTFGINRLVANTKRNLQLRTFSPANGNKVIFAPSLTIFSWWVKPNIIDLPIATYGDMWLGSPVRRVSYQPVMPFYWLPRNAILVRKVYWQIWVFAYIKGYCAPPNKNHKK